MKNGKDRKTSEEEERLKAECVLSLQVEELFHGVGMYAGHGEDGGDGVVVTFRQ